MNIWSHFHLLGNLSTKLPATYNAGWLAVRLAYMDENFEIEEHEELSFGLDDEEPNEVEGTWLDK